MVQGRSLAHPAVIVPPFTDPSADEMNWLAAARSRTFAALPHQVAAVRRYLAGLLGGSPATDDVLVCVSELATNAMRHSRSADPGGTFTVHAHRRPGRWRIGVSDKGGAWLARPQAGDADQLTSRGLAIVAALSARVKIEPYGAAGRLVWFEIED